MSAQAGTSIVEKNTIDENELEVETIVLGKNIDERKEE